MIGREPTSSMAARPHPHRRATGSQIPAEGPRHVAPVAPARAEALDHPRPAAPLGPHVASGEADACALHGPEPTADPRSRAERAAHPPPGPGRARRYRPVD